MKLKHKNRLSFFLAMLIINSVVIFYYSFLLIQRGLFRHKQILKGIDYQTQLLIQEDPDAPTSSLKAAIEDGIRFANNGKPISYLIIYGDNHRITNHDNLVIPETRKNRQFTWNILDLSTCKFEYVLKNEGFTAYLSEEIHHEFFQDVFVGLAISFIIVSLLALYFARITSQRLVSSLEDISTGVIKVKSGELNYRIPTHKKEYSELIELKIHLNQVFAWLEDFHQRISNFSAEMAHEIRTPLTSILGGLELALREDRTREDYQVVIAESMQNIKALHHLIEDMLLMVKSPSVFEQQFESCALSEILVDISSQMGILADSLGLQLKTDIAPDIFIKGIPSLFQRLIYNLIGNATKFTPTGGVIHIELTKNENEVKLMVSDTGVGIKSDELMHVFDRFFRGTHANQKGVGLGLSICKWVAELTKGEISMTSVVDEGTTVLVRWPIIDS